MRSGREAGSIAILALWGTAIIAILLAVVVRTTRAELRITENAVGLSHARLAAEAGAQLGLARLLRRRAEGVVNFDGTAERWQNGDTQVDIAILDEAGKIDLNQAPLELLSGLLTAVGRPPEEALLVACNILDWRGAAGAGCPEPPDLGGHRPHLFLVPEELAQVPGVTDTVYDAVADYVTVATKASAIDPFAASRPVLLAIPGATASLVDAYLDERARWHDLANIEAAAGLMRDVPAVMSSPARDFTIRSVATGGRLHYRADLQVRLTGTANRPYEFVAMRAPPPDRGAMAAAPARRVP